MHECKCTWVAQRHETWGECLRSKNVQVGDVKGRKRNQAYDASLDLYESARRQGVLPKTTMLRDVKAALAQSEATGVPFRDDVV